MDMNERQIALAVLESLRGDLIYVHLNNGSRVADLRQYIYEQMCRLRTNDRAKHGLYGTTENEKSHSRDLTFEWVHGELQRRTALATSLCPNEQLLTLDGKAERMFWTSRYAVDIKPTTTCATGFSQIKLSELSSVDQPGHSFQAYAVFIEAMNRRREGRPALASWKETTGFMTHITHTPIPKLHKAPQPPLSYLGGTPDSDRAKRPPLSEPPATDQELNSGGRVEGLGNFGKPTGEFGTVEQTNEDNAVVKWDDDGRMRLHQPSLKEGLARKQGWRCGKSEASPARFRDLL
jgi:hypothetical protein